jgi:hypothetical protein
VGSGLINSITLYVLIGVIISIFFDYVGRKITEAGGDTSFNDWEKFVIILIWPIVAIIFILGFIRNTLR